MFRTLLLVLFTIAVTACAGPAAVSYDTYSAYGADTVVTESYAPQTVSVASTGNATSSRRTVADRGERGPRPAPAQMAAASFEPAADMAPAPAVPDAERNDAGAQGPILIYTGVVQLSIFSVRETQEAIIALTEQAGGWVSDRGSHRLVVRVPAERFRSTLDAIAATGDVLQLDWNAQDVSEEYTDVQIRLRNASEMLARLEELLARAEKVEDLLAIEAQIERVTLEIETLTGRMRSLNDRIAYSTITITFAIRQPQHLPSQQFQLPISVLQQVGLRPLLRF